MDTYTCNNTSSTETGHHKNLGNLKTFQVLRVHFSAESRFSIGVAVASGRVKFRRFDAHLPSIATATSLFGLQSPIKEFSRIFQFLEILA
jgi:hypothetical protein